MLLSQMPNNQAVIPKNQIPVLRSCKKVETSLLFGKFIDFTPIDVKAVEANFTIVKIFTGSYLFQQPG